LPAANAGGGVFDFLLVDGWDYCFYGDALFRGGFY